MSAPDAARSRALDRRIARHIALGALAMRVATSLIGLVVQIVFPVVDHPTTTFFSWHSPYWDQFVHGDSGWYEGIARRGYEYVVDSRMNIAFFPAYPELMHYVGRVFGTFHYVYYAGGLIVSWLSFVGAMVALYYLARLDVSPRIARRAVLLTAIFPFSFFFGQVYTESMFLLFALLGFYGFRTRRWIVGGLCASVAIATRVPGILMMPALAWVAWKAAQPSMKDRGMAALGLVIAVGGFAWYCGFIYSISGDPLSWVWSIQKWDYHPGGAPWTTPARIVWSLLTRPYDYVLSGPDVLFEIMYGVTGLVFVALVPIIWRRLGAAYALFVLLSLYLPFSSGATEGIGRYCSVLFPVFIWLATIRSRAIQTGLVVWSAMLYPIAFAIFLTDHHLY